MPDIIANLASGFAVALSWPVIGYAVARLYDAPVRSWLASKRTQLALKRS